MEEIRKQLRCWWDLQEGPDDFSMSIQELNQILMENHYKSRNCGWPLSVANILGLAVSDGESCSLAWITPCLLEIAKCSGLIRILLMVVLYFY